MTTDSALAAAPQVSVVIPCYNGAAFIGATLRSVQAQSFVDFEMLVVDDGSRDATAAVVEAMAAVDRRIRLIRLERNSGGPATPRNVGVSQARGRWIAFLDADDIWHPDKLRSQLTTMQRNGAKFCCSRMIDFVDEARLAFTAVAGDRVARITFLSHLVKSRIPTSSVLLEAELARRHPFNEDPSYRAREDFVCWAHCLEEIGSSIKVQHPLIGYRVSSQQISGDKWLMMKRHYHVLKEYRFRSGRRLGLSAALFTFTHMALSAYYRLMLREL